MMMGDQTLRSYETLKDPFISTLQGRQPSEILSQDRSQYEVWRFKGPILFANQ